MANADALSVAAAFIVLSACGGESSSPPPATSRPLPSTPLSQCFASAGAAPNVDEALAQCEKKHFGTEWRAHPQVHGMDGGMRTPTTMFLDPELIKAGVQSRFPAMRRCYEDLGLAKNKDLRGRVTAKLVIDADGRVESAGDEHSDLPSAEVIACILGELEQIRFPKPINATALPKITVVYPIVFNPSG